jgi:hypothetical protein
VVAGSVAGLQAASLAEVIERSALQARIEHRYLVPLERFAELAARLPDTYAVLEIDQLRGFAYESVYFDTPDLLTYRQHLQGRRRRYKVRTRAYLDSGTARSRSSSRGGGSRRSRRGCPTPSPTGHTSTRRRTRSSPTSSGRRTASPHPSWPRR